MRIIRGRLYGPKVPKHDWQNSRSGKKLSHSGQKLNQSLRVQPSVFQHPIAKNINIAASTNHPALLTGTAIENTMLDLVLNKWWIRDAFTSSDSPPCCEPHSSTNGQRPNGIIVGVLVASWLVSVLLAVGEVFFAICCSILLRAVTKLDHVFHRACWSPRKNVE